MFPERKTGAAKKPERGEEAIDGVLRKCILRWHGHVERKGMSIVRTHYVRIVWRGSSCRWKKTWHNSHNWMKRIIQHHPQNCI